MPDTSTITDIPMSTPAKRRALTLDVDLYQGYLDDPELSEEQKKELIEALWSIIIGFVDLGFSVQAGDTEKSCGQILEANAECSEPPNDAVDSEKVPLTNTFERTADIQARGEKEES